MFKFDEINGKKILVSDILPSYCVKHLFTTRESVVTPKELTELTLLSDKNLKEIADYLQIKPENIISPVQTHSDNVAVAVAGEQYPDTDALVVDSTDIAVLLNFADCIPIILFDKLHNVGAVVHAGWRGTAQRIVQKTIRFMKEHYNTDSSDIVALIGPGISKKNYQVDKDVFIQLKSSLDKDYNDYYEHDVSADKFSVDLKTINQHQLEELCVETIDKCEYCTYDSVDVFFSYRKEYGKTARHSAILKLTDR